MTTPKKHNFASTANLNRIWDCAYTGILLHREVMETIGGHNPDKYSNYERISDYVFSKENKRRSKSKAAAGEEKPVGRTYSTKKKKYYDADTKAELTSAQVSQMRAAGETGFITEEKDVDVGVKKFISVSANNKFFLLSLVSLFMDELKAARDATIGAKLSDALAARPTGFGAKMVDLAKRFPHEKFFNGVDSNIGSRDMINDFIRSEVTGLSPVVSAEATDVFDAFFRVFTQNLAIYAYSAPGKLPIEVFYNVLQVTLLPAESVGPSVFSKDFTAFVSTKVAAIEAESSSGKKGPKKPKNGTGATGKPKKKIPAQDEELGAERDVDKAAAAVEEEE